MSEISIIEFIVYGLICYTGVILLIISSFKETPMTVSQSAVRVIWLIPSIICASMLASAGADIILPTEVITRQVLDSNNAIVTLTETSVDKVTLLQPVWVTLHFLFFIVMLLYVLFNILALFTKRD